MFKVRKGEMPRILPPCFAALVACTPSPQEAIMRKPGPVPANAAPEAGETRAAGQGPAADSPAEAEGRRTLSTAFVRLGAGEHLMVELRDGSTVVLRDVDMGPRDYCGVQVGGDRFCGGYGDVAAARPTVGS